MNDTIIADRNYDRLDMFLSEKLDKTRSYVRQLIEGGKVKIDGKTAEKCGKNIKSGAKVQVQIDEPQELKVEKQDIPLDIIYSDNDLAVINKQQGLTVHPAGKNYSNTLVNALMFHIDNLSDINGIIRPGIVHRLDKDTSGIMVIAKNDKAHLNLSAQLAAHSMTKIYLAITEGVIKEDSGVINANIGRSIKDRKKMAVTAAGRTAVTEYKVITRFKQNTFVMFHILTGRTHQIRVHSAYIGHPIVGDPVYGFKKQRFNLNGQLLHSYCLKFCHPSTETKEEFCAPLPQYFINIYNILAEESGLPPFQLKMLDKVKNEFDNASE